jgi:hypothetical protein
MSIFQSVISGSDPDLLDDACMHRMLAVCNPSLQDFTKDSINPALIDDACMHRMLAVCNQSLQDFTKDSINPALLDDAYMHASYAGGL